MEEARVGEDQREDERYGFELPSELVAADGAILSVTVTSVSRRGFSARHASPLSVNCRIGLRLDDGAIQAARVVWMTQTAMGCEFEQSLTEDQLLRVRQRHGIESTAD